MITIAKRFLIVTACLLLPAGVSFSQGAFQNLGFDSPNVANLPPGGGFVSVSDAFPGWAGYLGSDQTTQAYFKGASLGAAAVSLIDRTTPFYSNDVIAGSYTAVITAGDGPLGNFASAALAQTGQVPTTAKSLRFGVGTEGGIGDLGVTFNGQSLPFTPLLTLSNAVIYGSEISSFAGQTGELRFTEQPGVSHFDFVYLDAISFSTQPIPEPGACSVACIGAAFGAFKLLKRRR
jgi:hypothetical protein